MDRSERIRKECFWDYNITSKDIEKIFHSGSKYEKKKLFDKIFFNSKDKISDLSLFTTKELREFFIDLNLNYCAKYIIRHILILKFLFFNEKVDVKGLEWKKR